MALSKDKLKSLKEVLEAQCAQIRENARRTRADEMAMDVDDLADEMDLASSEYTQSFTLRLRGREKVALEKAERAIEKIADGNFGLCEECGEEISVKRIEARPETELCIHCQEEQERATRDLAGARC